MCEEEAQAHAIAQGLFARSGLTKEDRRYALRNWDRDANPSRGDDPGAQVAYAMAVRLVAGFALWRARGRGLWFIGPTGTGKSHLAKGIGLALIAKGHAVQYVRVPTLLDRMVRRSGPTWEEIIDPILRGEAVILDEARVKPDRLEEFAAVIDALYEARTVVIVTTNYEPDQLAPALGQPTVSRLERMCHPVLLTGEDYRKRQAGSMREEELA